VLVLGREKEGLPPDVLQLMHACVEIPQVGIIRSLNVHVAGAIALYQYTVHNKMKGNAANGCASILQ
jgi:tRNA guanosine-2'-O-methyltransferase